MSFWMPLCKARGKPHRVRTSAFLDPLGQRLWPAYLHESPSFRQLDWFPVAHFCPATS